MPEAQLEESFSLLKRFKNRRRTLQRSALTQRGRIESGRMVERPTQSKKNGIMDPGRQRRLENSDVVWDLLKREK
jgi:hypothetical protein